jgi:hypothetical protein
MNLADILKEQHIVQPAYHKPRYTEEGALLLAERRNRKTNMGYRRRREKRRG